MMQRGTCRWEKYTTIGYSECAAKVARDLVMTVLVMDISKTVSPIKTGS